MLTSAEPAGGPAGSRSDVRCAAGACRQLRAAAASGKGRFLLMTFKVVASSLHC